MRLSSRTRGGAGRFLRGTKPWILTFAACFAVTFINPYGWELHRHVIEYITDPYQLQHITRIPVDELPLAGRRLLRAVDGPTLVMALWDARHRRFAEFFWAWAGSIWR